ncbi:MAG: hypothetical protein KC996_00935 [Phycisphaerales bacterium]|nr:hypothetical protein [Phycisphaerales bacterium]
MNTTLSAALLLTCCTLNTASGSVVTYRIEGLVRSIEYLSDPQFADLGLGGPVSIDLVFDDDAAPILSEGAMSTWTYRTGLSTFRVGNHAYTPENLDGWNSFSFTNSPSEDGEPDRLTVGGQMSEKGEPGNFFVQINLDSNFVAGDQAAVFPPLTAPSIEPVSSVGYFNVGNPAAGVALSWEVSAIRRVPAPGGLMLACIGLASTVRRRR